LASCSQSVGDLSDLEIGTLSVRESVYEGKFQSPKTLRSRRTIPIGPQAISWLKEHRRLRATRTALDDLVFGNRNGQPLRESKLLQKILQPAAKAAGLGRVTWHQFRHIHSSLLNDLRVPVKIAQEQLGHASIATTLNIYTHVVDASPRGGGCGPALFGDLDPNGPSCRGRSKRQPRQVAALTTDFGGAARI
jgi:integrase